MLDLDYAEDSTAETDANFVITGSGGLVEVQGSAEGAPFSQAELLAMLELARGGIADLVRDMRAVYQKLLRDTTANDASPANPAHLGNADAHAITRRATRSGNAAGAGTQREEVVIEACHGGLSLVCGPIYTQLR